LSILAKMAVVSAAAGSSPRLAVCLLVAMPAATALDASVGREEAVHNTHLQVVVVAVGVAVAVAVLVDVAVWVAVRVAVVVSVGVSGEAAVGLSVGVSVSVAVSVVADVSVRAHVTVTVPATPWGFPLISLVSSSTTHASAVPRRTLPSPVVVPLMP
jgi:hypothetical protein